MRVLRHLRQIVPFCLILFVVVTAHTDECAFDGASSDWNGFTLHEFEVDGRACKVVCPHVAEDGKPWIWRARFWGHEPQTDIALLEAGFHVAYMEVGALFGNPTAVAHWDAFHAYLTEEFEFSSEPALEGMSRGGLIIYNWAIANPDKVACIYADAPVLDIRSWPGGKGIGKGSESDWRACMRRYKLTEETAANFSGNPIDNLKPLADAGIPLLHVVGAADDIVPVAENSAILEKRYKELGGTIHVISKEGVGHHPHSLKDPQPIVDFIRGYASGNGDPYFEVRSGLDNSGAIFSGAKQGRVAFLGGSITEMTGWREKTSADLKRRFPETELDFVDAGISSTDSTYHSFRLEEHVFGRGKVDLLFIESTVNEQHNMREQQERIRGLEGILRHARALNPEIDIVVQYFIDPAQMEYWEKGEVPPIILDQDRVARHYDVPAINLAREISDSITAGDFEWKDFGDAHPKPFGHEIYANRIARLFDAAWSGGVSDAATVSKHETPGTSIDPFNYERGRFVDIQKAEVILGWNYVEDWQPSDRAGRRKQFTNVATLEALKPGADFVMPFEGTAIGIMVTAGPDVGMLEYSIDGIDYPPLDQFTPWSEGLHIPWAYMLATELEPGTHRLTLKTSDMKNEKSKGYTSRIQQFLVN